MKKMTPQKSSDTNVTDQNQHKIIEAKDKWPSLT